MNKTFIIVFGPPGSGKGTQAKKLSDKLNLPLISTGDILRHEIKLGSPLGKKVEQIMARGSYVSDEIMGEIIEKRLRKADARAGAIFDGYPRTEAQQKFLVPKLKKLTGKEGKLVGVLVEVSDKEVKSRLGGRRACICGQVYHLKFNPPKVTSRCDDCGGKLYVRNDDKPEVIKERLKTYHEKTEPLLAFWSEEGMLIEVNGELPIAKVAQEIARKLKKML